MGQKFFSPVFFKNSSLLKECESIFIEMEIYFYSLFIFHHPHPTQDQVGFIVLLS